MFKLRAPKDQVKNRVFREWLLRRAVGDKGFQRAVVERCRQDLVFYIDSFVYQYNPTKRGPGAAGPFIIWPFQEESLVARPETHEGKCGFLWCYENNRSAVLEKSREMGATWIFLILQDWLCLFHENVQTMNISHNAEAVDCKKKDSLFAKVRFMHRHLPDWLKGEIVEQEMYFGYQRTDSEVTGYASTGRAGVGGRAGIIFIDEVSKIREAREVRHHTASTAYCRFFNSTHEGTGTEFYDLSRSKEFIQWQWHWTAHPEKTPGQYWYNPKKQSLEVLDKAYSFPLDYEYRLDGTPKGGPHPGVRSPWYDRKVAEIGSELGAAVELDINPEGSVQQCFDPLLIRELIANYCRPGLEGDVIYDADTGRIQSFHQRPRGAFKLWTALDDHGKPVAADYFIGSDVANGQGATPTCISIFNGSTGEKAAQYTNARIDPIQTGLLMVGLGYFFCDGRGRPARLIWELIGPGFKAGEKIMELGYPNFYIRTDEMRLDQKQTMTPGWVPTKPNKYRLILDYAEALKTREFLNLDEECLRETAQFRWKAGEPVHEHEDTEDDADARSSHGDRVIADALAWKEAKRVMGGAVAVERRRKKNQDENQQVLPLLSPAGRARYHEYLRNRTGLEWSPEVG